MPYLTIAINEETDFSDHDLIRIGDCQVEKYKWFVGLKKCRFLFNQKDPSDQLLRVQTTTVWSDNRDAINITKSYIGLYVVDCNASVSNASIIISATTGDKRIPLEYQKFVYKSYLEIGNKLR